MTAAPRILHIVTACPGAPTYGAQLRTVCIARALAQLGTLRMVLVAGKDFGAQAIARTRDMFDLLDVIPLHPTPRRSLRERVQHEVSVRYLNTVGTTASDADRARIQSWCAEHDLVWVQRLEIANSIGIYHWPHSVIDLDDLKSEYFAQQARLQPRWWDRRVRQRRAFLARRRERDVLNRFTIATVCSTEDHATLGSPNRVHVIPNGFERPTADPLRTAQPTRRLGFIGLIEYPPNREGLLWFANEVWPAVRAQVPGATLRIIGQGFAGSGLEAIPGFEALGFVDDPAAEIATWQAMIVPIQFGGGTRIKIAESFSRRCPVIATRAGAFGYPVTNERELLLADSPADFATACTRILQDPTLGPRLAEQGWELFLAQYTWDAIGERVRATARTALRSCPDSS